MATTLSRLMPRRLYRDQKHGSRHRLTLPLARRDLAGINSSIPNRRFVGPRLRVFCGKEVLPSGCENVALLDFRSNMFTALFGVRDVTRQQQSNEDGRSLPAVPESER